MSRPHTWSPGPVPAPLGPTELAPAERGAQELFPVIASLPAMERFSTDAGTLDQATMHPSHQPTWSCAKQCRI